MSFGLRIPLSKIPQDLAQAKSAIIQGLAEFGHAIPAAIWYETSQSDTHKLQDGKVEVQGRDPKDACSIAFSTLDWTARAPAEFDLPFSASVSTRTNFRYAGAIAFGLAKHFGATVVYDDSLTLQGVDRYTVDALRRVLRESNEA